MRAIKDPFRVSRNFQKPVAIPGHCPLLLGGPETFWVARDLNSIDYFWQLKKCFAISATIYYYKTNYYILFTKYYEMETFKI